MALQIQSFSSTGETVREAVNATQKLVNAWLGEPKHRTIQVHALQANTLSELNKATGGTEYAHIITLLVDQV